MIYRICTQTGKIRFFADVRSGGRIPYITAREMKKRFSDKSFVIIGEIGSLARAQTDGDLLYMEDGKAIPILPRGSLKWPFEWVKGYALVQKDSYVAVIGGFFHFVLSIGCNVKQSWQIKYLSHK